jgi:hypothetical protein
MTRIRILLITLPLFIGVAGESLAQKTAGGASIGFHNDTKTGILVQGMSNGRLGQPFLVTPGKTGYDSNVPQGSRVINIYDPAKRLMLTTQVPVGSRDMVFSVRPHPTVPGQVLLMPKKGS